MPDRRFKALSDPNRRFLVEQMLNSPRTVGELAARLPISRPAVYQHLEILRESELVVLNTSGLRKTYSINSVGFKPLKDWVKMFCLKGE